eukprot:309199-Prymnesium_polylepis.1
MGCGWDLAMGGLCEPAMGCGWDLASCQKVRAGRWQRVYRSPPTALRRKACRRGGAGSVGWSRHRIPARRGRGAGCSSPRSSAR